jgi:hypothetical protein
MQARNGTAPGNAADSDVSLEDDWGDAYLLSYTRDQWVALRRDSQRFVTAGTLAGLEKAIEADYRDNPGPGPSTRPGRSAT